MQSLYMTITLPSFHFLPHICIETGLKYTSARRPRLPISGSSIPYQFTLAIYDPISYSGVRVTFSGG